MDERQFLLSLDLSGSNENIVVPDINATSLSRQKYVIFYFVKFIYSKKATKGDPY